MFVQLSNTFEATPCNFGAQQIGEMCIDDDVNSIVCADANQIDVCLHFEIT